MSSAQEAMNTLSAQWYNAVIAGCHLDPNTFQLFQSNQPVGSTSQFLWNIFDAIPPMSITNYYNASQVNSFSADYGGVINNLKPQNATTFENVMADYFPLWMQYLKTSPPTPPGGILQLLQNWAALNMPPGQAQAAYTAYQQPSQGVVPVAVGLWLAAGGGAGGVKAYNNTIAFLNNSLPNAPSASVTMNSQTTSPDVSQTWAAGQISGARSIFYGSGNATWDSLTEQMYNAGVTITATFDHVMAFTAGPLSRPSNDPILSQYQPWYSSAALNLAYKNNNNVVWNNNPPTWDNTFGAGGNMLRICSSLIVVDGIKITTKANAHFSSSDQQSFRAAARAGMWPLFAVNGSGGWTSQVDFDDAGNATVTSSNPAGNPNILGAIVTPIDQVLGD